MEDTTNAIHGNGFDKDHHVKRAFYPLPQPLAERLRAAATANGGTTAPTTPAVQVETEPIPSALAQLVGNSLEAMDAMFFATPSALRQHDCFQHRLCLRVAADPVKQTLTLTDLGAGMTRADLINTLGIGRQLPTTNNSSNSKKKAVEQSTTDDESSGSEEDDDDEEEDDDDDSEEEEDTEEENQDPAPVADSTNTAAVVLPCKVKDIGGFYAAVCALALGFQVGTKSKFDDYYEFQVGDITAASPSSSPDTKAFEQFCITRPLSEGDKLAVDTGFDKFEDVRGDSGTRITLRLNQAAIDAGLLDEDKLKSIILKILETTQYSVAFSNDTEGAKAIVEASATEQEISQQLLKEPVVAAVTAEATGGNTAGLEEPPENLSGMDMSYKPVLDRAKYIPLRLSLSERKMLRLVEAAMNCCDYTTEVDRPFQKRAGRPNAQLKGTTAVLRGLVTACDYGSGQKLLQEKNYDEFQEFFQRMFEIARRHKIMNPEKMRTEYGKLIFLLQDLVGPTVQEALGFSAVGPIQSVYNFLEKRDGLALLSDKLIETATAEILAERKSRSQIDTEIRKKERAVAHIKRKYYTNKLSQEDIHLCLYSICDNNSFLNSKRVPIDKVIDFLKKHFSPTEIEEGYSLSIVSGEDGARLSHSHERQYYFALQSLTLWRDIIDDMFRLWAMAEEDLLSETVTYSLQDTGQGMQRVQQSPRTYKAMQQILVKVQAKVNHWVGSSVIHMGDHNVPNALSFIDKYTQVPRILGPIVSCLENLERLCDEDDGIKDMVDKGFGGMETLRKDMLYDFFRAAFDGSGADNFYDAGSCIDGRLTSAWNWCSKLPEKSFYPIFKLTGFKSFDGDFR